MTDAIRHRGGFADLVGYRLEAWREDYAEVVLAVEAKHLNRSGVTHGGVLSTLIDTAAGYAGCYCAVPGRVRRAFTVALNAHFIAAAEAGAVLTAAGRKTGGGRQIFFATCEVRDQDGRLIGQGDGVYRYRRGSEDPHGEPA
jgi:uncharacterized protein (TIGR00369 family)